MKAWYRPGDCAVAVAPRALVMAPADRAADLANVLEREHTALELLSLLARGDVARLPDLAAAVVDGDDLVLLVRGPFRITYGESQWSGEDTATWREYRVAAAAGDELLVERDGVDQDGLRLPIRCGVVLSGQVMWTPDLGAERVAGTGSAAGALKSQTQSQGQTQSQVESQVEAEAVAVEDVPVAQSQPQSQPVSEAADVAVPNEELPGAGDGAAESSGAESSEPDASDDSVAPASSDPEATRVEVDDNFDAMFGATVQGRRVQDAAMHSPGPAAERDGDAAPAPALAQPEALAPGDHDGRTITAQDVQKLRDQRSANARGAAPEQEPARPPAATLTISTGETVGLDRPVIIGRSPRATQTSSSALPHLVVVDDPYVSSTHLEVSSQGTSLVVIDRSTNGTTLTCPGEAAERLTKDEPRVLVDGSVLGLSDDLTATIAFLGERR